MEPKDTTLLIVDDEDTLREALVFDFEMRHFKVLSAANGKEAFEIIKSNKIDVVITDVRMPGGDGIELLERTKQHNLAIPVVIFITGFADLTTDEAYEKGSAAVFGKPFERKALLEAVKKVIQPREILWAKRSDLAPPRPIYAQKFRDLQLARDTRQVSLGRSGIFLRMTDQFPAVNERVSFRIDFTDETTPELAGAGIVRWVRNQQNGEFSPGIGIEFDYIEEPCRSKVIALIDRVNPKAYIPRT